MLVTITDDTSSLAADLTSFVIPAVILDELAFAEEKYQ